MSDDTNCTPEDLKRVPGLFRRWELSEVLDTDRGYHLEDAGTHIDGTPLLAIYTSDAQSCTGARAEFRDAPDLDRAMHLSPTLADERFISQPELARRWDISPRTLERWRRTQQGPAFLKLGYRVVYSLRHVQAFEIEHLHRVRRHVPARPGRGGQS